MNSFFKGVLVGLSAVGVFVLILAPIILAALFSWMYLLGYAIIIPLLVGCVGVINEW